MKKSYLLIILLSLSLMGCDEEAESSTTTERRQQEVLSKQAVQQVGMPAITNYREKRVLKTILEMRDQSNLSTFTYIRDMSGKLHKLCNSVGYPIPYSTQYTNPQKISFAEHGYGVGILPQADPNGLYSPASAEGTWVLCQNPKDKSSVMPVYVEDRVTSSTFELDN